MKLAHVHQIAVFYAPAPDRRQKVGRLALVRAAIARFKRFADQAGVPARLRDKIAKVIAPAKR